MRGLSLLVPKGSPGAFWLSSFILCQLLGSERLVGCCQCAEYFHEIQAEASPPFPLELKVVFPKLTSFSQLCFDQSHLWLSEEGGVKGAASATLTLCSLPVVEGLVQAAGKGRAIPGQVPVV